jgi:putative N6-adenine-specific DNA methylase
VAFSAFAVTAPGLESLAAGELSAHGLTPSDSERGGVAFDASEQGLATALINLRTVTRIIVRVAEFRATSFAQLEQRANAVRWREWVAPGTRVRFRVTCRKSRLYHSDAVAERLERAITLAVRGATIAEGPAGDDDADDTAQLFIVRMADNVCTISADAAGAPLYRRGYRQAIAKAPLRETLAAAMLLGAGWTGTSALVDPMCGSGTLAIEGALIARRIAPGASRSFAAERWPTARSTVWSAARAVAASNVLENAAAPIVASDRDDGAIVAACSNAERAGVAVNVEFARATISEVHAPADSGLLITNPPYGIRVGDVSGLRDLYATFGRVATQRFSGWRCAVLSGDQTRGRELDRHMGIAFGTAWSSTNGGIPVRLLVADL